MLSSFGARMHQHVLDDTVGAFSVLYNFGKVAAEYTDQVFNLGLGLGRDRAAIRSQGAVQLVDQFAR